MMQAGLVDLRHHRLESVHAAIEVFLSKHFPSSHGNKVRIGTAENYPNIWMAQVEIDSERTLDVVVRPEVELARVIVNLSPPHLPYLRIGIFATLVSGVLAGWCGWIQSGGPSFAHRIAMTALFVLIGTSLPWWAKVLADYVNQTRGGPNPEEMTTTALNALLLEHFPRHND